MVMVMVPMSRKVILSALLIPERSCDGTCSGTAGSTTYGVSKRARLIAVKVLSDSKSVYHYLLSLCVTTRSRLLLRLQHWVQLGYVRCSTPFACDQC